MRCHGEVKRWDGRLASLARTEAGLRLRLGQVLEVMGRGKHFELGFSSLAAYALERCDRSVRWVEGARCLARRLEELPELRRALALGRVSWSMGELLARVAHPGDETRWMEAAESRTVREMKVLVLKALADARGKGVVAMAEGAVDAGAVDAGAVDAGAVNEGAMAEGAVNEGAMAEGAIAEGAMAEGAVNEGAVNAGVLDERAEVLGARAGTAAQDGEGDEMRTLSCTVAHEEAWLFEATRTLLEQLGVYGADAQVEALLAEGHGTLLAARPADALEMQESDAVGSAQQSWLRQLSRWRAEAEIRCEQHFRGSVVGGGKARPVGGVVAEAASLGLAALERVGSHDLDGMLRGLSRLLGSHELELARLVLQLHRANGWRRLGYASEAQYACERLGMSRSSFVARRALALHLQKLPHVAAALGAGQIGVEAALQIVRVATPNTQAAWVARAGQRTIKHLREEVGAALIAVRLSGEVDCPPPLEAELVGFQELEQAVVSGRACQPRLANDVAAERDLAGQRFRDPSSAPRRAWLVMLGSLARWLEGGLQMSAARDRACVGPGGAPAAHVGSRGRIALRWRVSRSNYSWWRGLEARVRRWLPSGMSWLSFLCLSFWSAWRHLLGPDVAYGQIYIRDRYRCSSPVCSRRDVTPHHLQFRSAGGSDAPGNVTSVCCWCHLFGVHGGRIRAAGTAERIRWELGPPGRACVVVLGRERVAA